MADFYHHVYLSPHLDDAVLSCGGRLHRQVRAGRRPLVITLFAGLPPGEVELSSFAKSLHARWGNNLREVVAARWIEDQAALAALGVDYLRLDYPDCIYRGRGRAGRPGFSDDSDWYYPSEESLFGPVHPAEEYFPTELAATLCEFIPPAEGATLLAPLTVGNHVDHQLTFAAATILRAQGWHVRFYEEYPYVEREGGAAAALAARGAQHWAPGVASLDEEDLVAKVRAIACYESQLEVLFGSAEAMPDRVRSYFLSIGGERLWDPALPDIRA